MNTEVEAFLMRRKSCLAGVEAAIKKRAPLLSEEVVKAMAPIFLGAWQDCRKAFDHVEVYDFMISLGVE